VDPRLRHRLLRGRRRHQPAARRAHRLPHAARAARLVGLRSQEDADVLRLRAAARERDDGRLRVARSVPLLRLLGRDARPDVLPHRRLGLRAARLRGGEVHPLHDGGQRADAARDPEPRVPPLHGNRQLQLRSAEALRPPAHAAPAAVDVPRVRARVRDQGAALPVPHVAARRARGGADRRLGDSGRRAAEDGDLWLRALRVPAVPRRRRLLRAVARRARDRRHHLRRARRDGAARHEEAGRLLERQPSWVRRPRYRGAERAGRAGRRLPDAEPRGEHRRPLPDRRHAVGSPAHAAHRRVRRPEERDAASGRRVPHRHAVVDRPARPERLRRRVPDPARRVPLESDAGGVRGDRRDPVGDLHAVDVPARELRRRDEREERAAARSAATGVGGDRAGDRGGGGDGGVPEPVPPSDRAVGRADARADPAHGVDARSCGSRRPRPGESRVSNSESRHSRLDESRIPNPAP